MAGRITDISERLSTAAHLREAVQRLRLAADAAGIGVWNWNFADDSLEWDDRMCELYGVPKSIRDNVFYYEIWRASLHPEDLTHAETTLRDAVRTGNPWKTFFRIVLPNGSIRHIQTSSIIDYDRKGAPLRMIGINRDVTEQMSYEQFLQDTNARLEQRVAERTLELRTLVAELERANAGKDAFWQPFRMNCAHRSLAFSPWPKVCRKKPAARSTSIRNAMWPRLPRAVTVCCV
ncbi:MAG: PAS domain-containing protein [Anaerolineales bacterium]|nr:PAS domain-containing protein [Anaerolineales bacterium]